MQEVPHRNLCYSVGNTKGRVVNTPISVGAQRYCLHNILHNHANSSLPPPIQKKQFNGKGLLIYLTSPLMLGFCYPKAAASGQRREKGYFSNIVIRDDCLWGFPLEVTVTRGSWFWRVLSQAVANTSSHTIGPSSNEPRMNLLCFLKTNKWLCVVLTIPVCCHVKHIWMTSDLQNLLWSEAYLHRPRRFLTPSMPSHSLCKFLLLEGQSKESKVASSLLWISVLLRYLTLINILKQ